MLKKYILLLLSLIITITLTGCGGNKTGLSVPIVNGVKHGEAIYREGNGEITGRSTWVNGKMEGKSYSYYRGKAYLEENYLHGKLNGITKKYNSRKYYLETETPYKNGIKDGVEKYYYPNRKLKKEVTYKNGLKVGVEKEWTTTGKLVYTTPYTQGKLNRKRVLKHPNGNLYLVQQWKMGKQVGYEMQYDREGILLYKTSYKGKIPKRVYQRPDTIVNLDKKHKKSTNKHTKKASTIRLKCSSGDPHLSMSEIRRKEAIAKGKGEGAALGYQMGSKKAMSKVQISNYCTSNANAQDMACHYASIYVSACKSKF